MVKYILLLDDDAAFREATVSRLSNDEVAVTAPAATKKSVFEVLGKQDYDLVLVDFGIKIDGIGLERLLGEIQNKTPPACVVRIISGRDFKKHTIDQYCADFPKLARHWLAKPLDEPGIQMILEDVKHNQDSFSQEYSSWPIPIRIVNLREARIEYQNNWPFAVNRPRPESLIGVNVQPGEAVTHDYRDLALPLSESYFRIVSFCKHENPNFLVQQAIKMPNIGTHDFSSLLDQVFLTMQESGFTHGHFYRVFTVPGCRGLMQLERRFGRYKEAENGFGDFPEFSSHAQWCNRYYESFDATIPLASDSGEIQRGRFGPIDGVTSGRLDAMTSAWDSASQHLLVYNLVTPEDLPTGRKLDRFFKHWVNLVETQEIQTWLELPIFSSMFRQRQGEGEKECPIAFFLFDRRDATDGTNIVEEHHIEPIRDRLLHIVEAVGRHLERDEAEQRNNDLQKLHSAADSLFSLTDIDDAVQTLTVKAAEIVSAETAVLATREAWHSSSLRFVGTFGKVSGLENRIFLPTDDARYPIVQSWREGKLLALPELASDERQQRILAAVEELEYIDPDAKQQYRNWVKEDVGSKVCLPIYFGEEKIGALTLSHSSSHHFSEVGIGNVEIFLRRTRGFLAQLKQLKLRQRWEQLFAHEAGTHAAPLLKDLNAAIKEDTDGAFQRALSKARTSAYILNDTAELPEYLMSVDAGKAVFSNFSPAELINENIALFTHMLHERNLNFDPTQVTTLNDQKITSPAPQKLFEAALRVILHNAAKFCTESGHLEFGSEVTQSHWCLILRNSGQIDEQDQLASGVAQVTPYHLQQRSGAGRGLSLLRDIMLRLGGDVTLENDQGRAMVEARLYWPIGGSKIV